MVGRNPQVRHGADRLAPADFSHVLVDVWGQPGPFSIKQESQLVVVAVSEINNADGGSCGNGLLENPACSERFVVFMRSQDEDPVLVRQRGKGWKIDGWILQGRCRGGRDA